MGKADLHRRSINLSLTIRKGDNKTEDNSGLIIARDKWRRENNSEPIRGELKHKTISL